MKIRKSGIVFGVILLLVSVAAFAAGMRINRGLDPLGLLGLTRNGILVVTDILPAKELPKIPPEVEGLFVERKDHLVVVQGSRPNQDPGGVEVGSVEDVGGGPRIEVLVTAETILYRDTTQLPSERPSINNNPAVQQTVMEGTLEDLIDSHTYIMAWGRRSGDRVIADILVYSYLTTIQEP